MGEDYSTYGGGGGRGSQSGTFNGVRFILVGFNPSEENEVEIKLISGGGVNVVQYGSNCTHVIVDKIVYDDDRCVAARKDGKSVVNSAWVDHSFHAGMPVNSSLILYRPVKDLNGIAAANSFVVCLTGYQTQALENIMRMVRMMGAKFSKSLVGNTVTHLICYRFEGDKYKLAKQINRIKLVNHRWLQDCSPKLQAGRGMSTSKGSDLTMPVRERFDINQQTSAAKDLLHPTENTTSNTSINSSKHQNSGKQAKRKDGDLLTSKADQVKEVVGGVINEERTNMVEAKRRLCHASKACENKDDDEGALRRRVRANFLRTKEEFYAKEKIYLEEKASRNKDAEDPNYIDDVVLQSMADIEFVKEITKFSDALNEYGDYFTLFEVGHKQKSSPPKSLDWQLSSLLDI
ncbi:hypothetical protein MKW92_024268 [Papaver armeniacum]|nr:hypothetical protein MKW92_024268 [Papaver armeniacum]